MFDRIDQLMHLLILQETFECITIFISGILEMKK